MCKKVYVIAEAGVNHNGSLDRARSLIDVAADSGADAVKFQTFSASNLAIPDAPKAEYQTKNTGSSETQYQMIERLELSEADHELLILHCQSKGIEFLSTPFDLNSLDLLVRKLNLRKLKISSGDLTNAPLLYQAAMSGRSIILSTGMSDLEEIRAALGVLAFGYLKSGETPSVEAFHLAYLSNEGRQLLAEKVVLLHCTTEYPAPFEDINLRAIETMRQTFNIPIGYSDHAEGISISIAAVAFGADVIEKHFTLDRSLPGPDHIASIEPEELKQLVQSIREVSIALGSSEKRPSTSELKNVNVARKSLVTTSKIRGGEIFTKDNVSVKRPGDGLSPFYYWDKLGRESDRDYSIDEKIKS